VKNVEIFRT